MANSMDLIGMAADILDRMAQSPNFPWAKNWLDKIDVDNLNMNDGDYCLLGQIGKTQSPRPYFGDLRDAVINFNAEKWLTEPQVWDVFDDHTAEWKTLIRTRRAIKAQVSDLIGKKYSRTCGTIAWTVIGDTTGNDGKRVITLDNDIQYATYAWHDFSSLFAPYVEPFKLNPGEMATAAGGRIYIADAEGAVWFVGSSGKLLKSSGSHSGLTKLTVPGRPAITFNANEVNAL